MRKIVLVIASLLVTANAQSATRPSLITEKLYVSRGFTSIYDQRYSRYTRTTGQRNDELLWNKALLSIGLKSTLPKNRRFDWNPCHYETAIRILKEIRSELGANTPYQKTWAENQLRVFTACTNRNKESSAPLTPQGDHLPDRAQDDYKYQYASWNFYKGDYEEALKLYSELSENRASSLRGLASYMVVRCLSSLHSTVQAYQKAEEILADNSLLDVHNITANQRFILMYQNSGDGRLAEKHLRWLLGIIKIDPFSVADMDQSLADYFDALKQLDRYFPLVGDNNEVDWWLHKDIELTSPRMQAVHNLAQDIEIVDWMQASWALNVFDKDWLWALHDEQNPYWAQNTRIVEHAWNRYKNGDSLEWLGIAIQRVHPDSPHAKEILNEAKKYLDAETDTETDEYKEWLQSIWQHAIRLELGLARYEAAVSLASEQKFNNIPDRYNPHRISIGRVIHKAIRYLVYVGAFDQARTLLTHTSSLLQGHDKLHWQTLLTTSGEDLIHLGTQPNQPPPLWMAMVNTFSAEWQKSMGSWMPMQGKLSLAALTKAMLLGKDDIYEYASLAADTNILIKPEILAAVENKDTHDYVEFMLRTPRMRLVPLPLHLHPYSLNEHTTPTQIDTYNHNDNNWWCRYNPKKLSNEIWESARIVPHRFHTFAIGSSGTAKQTQKNHDEKLRSLLNAHPYHKYTDAKEDEKLAMIPSGPQYLSEEVIAHEKQKGIWENFWPDIDEANNSAANLYYAVRTTRYGCSLNGPHTSYSYGAFELLHDNYEDSVWARKTPYWFK